ncbi:hypothetical protein FRC07_014818 [Ceratobasidium sp. 392]|nr:hypothetical protein FRC07_014818 [Ceratobasidium sp. 392]
MSHRSVNAGSISRFQFGGNRLMRSNFIAAASAGIPVPLATGILGPLLELLKQDPTAEATKARVEGCHADKLAPISNIVTASVHRKSVDIQSPFVMHWTEDSFEDKAADVVRAWD